MPRRVASYPSDVDVIVVHWPNEFFFRASFKKWFKSWMSLARLGLGRRSRIRLVWVVHNVLPHVRAGKPDLLLRKAFLKRVDGLIFLSQSSRELLLQHFPETASLRYITVPHGVYPSVAAAPQHQSTITDRPVRLAFTGMVASYKSPDRLAELVRSMPAFRVQLQISGRCNDADLQSRLENLSGPNVSLDLRYQGDAELERVVDESDALVIPYRDILNSGSALYALSRWRPILAPRLGSLVELQREVGEDWVHLYDGELTNEVLSDFVAKLRRRTGVSEIDLSRHSWERIGGEVSIFLHSLVKP